jgi:hypothetical protein
MALQSPPHVGDKPIHYSGEVHGLGGLLILQSIALVLGMAAYWRSTHPGWIALTAGVAVLIWRGLRWTSDWEKRIVAAALETTPEDGLLSDDVFGTEPVWRLDTPTGKKIYLNWMTRDGLRRSQVEPVYISWWLGSDKPHGKSLAYAHPVRFWMLEDSYYYLVEGDESYFLCRSIGVIENTPILARDVAQPGQPG